MSKNLDSQRFWDSQASIFDEQPDHGLRDPAIQAAWVALLSQWLPPPKASVLDIGCGTGSLSLVLAQLGHTVTGVDFSPAMLEIAQTKVGGQHPSSKWHVMNATALQFTNEKFDVIVCRHLLWALPNPIQVLQHWAGFLNSTGRLLLIEGFWHTGAGLHLPEVAAALPNSLPVIAVEQLSQQPKLWGGIVSDERYIVIAGNP